MLPSMNEMLKANVRECECFFRSRYPFCYYYIANMHTYTIKRRNHEMVLQQQHLKRTFFVTFKFRPWTEIVIFLNKFTTLSLLLQGECWSCASIRYKLLIFNPHVHYIIKLLILNIQTLFTIHLSTIQTLCN